MHRTIYNKGSKKDRMIEIQLQNQIIQCSSIDSKYINNAYA